MKVIKYELIESTFIQTLRKYFDLFVLLFFTILWALLAQFLGLPVLTPGASSIYFIYEHYIFPIVLALIAQIVLIVSFKAIGKKSDRLSKRKSLVTFFYIPYFIIVLFLHFNFKAWTPLINPNLYDTFYQNIDNVLPFVQWFDWIGNHIDFYGMPAYLYLKLFMLMFILSFLYHAVFDSLTNLRKLITGTALILLVGGISYWIMPAIGPFLFQDSTLAIFPVVQDNMLRMYNELRTTGIVSEGYFTAAPAAMPSLHTANSMFFLVMAVRSRSILTIPYALIFIFIIIIAVASKWHYFIDLIFGALLCILISRLIDWAIKDDSTF